MKKIVISKLRGGLGNQMFQYALGRNLALKNRSDLTLDLIEFDLDQKRIYELDVFDLNPSVKTSKVSKIYKMKIIFLSKMNRNYSYNIEKDHHFDAEVLEKEGSVILDGYWQSEQYIADSRTTLQSEFRIRSELDEDNKAMLKRIHGSESICLHVRRGDYASDKKTNEIHGMCTMDYYKRSIKKIESLVQDPKFFVFSDDIQWVKDNLRIDQSCVFVDFNKTAIDDFRLMSNCKHFIIANSSFSWWAAWLPDNEDKVVCAPQPWFANRDEGDIVPKGWVRIDR